MSAKKTVNIGSAGVHCLLHDKNIVQHSGIANCSMIWYRNRTIFGETLKYTLFRTSCYLSHLLFRMFGVRAIRPTIPKIDKWHDKFPVDIYQIGAGVTFNQTNKKGGYRKFMREFMTKVSDYFNEWRENPDREENQISPVVVGVVITTVIVLLLLLLWWGHGVQEKKKEEAAERARQLQEAQDLEAREKGAREREAELEAELEAQGLVATTYEEKMKEYMSRDSGEELRKEYLENTNTMTEKIGEMQTALEQVQQEISKLISDYRTGDSRISEKLTVLETEVKAAIENMKNLDSRLTALSDVIQTVDREKIPAIEEQIKEIRSGTEQVRSDVSGIREKMKSLEKEDERLWASLSKVQRTLMDAMEKNVDEIDGRLENLLDDMGSLEKELKEALENAEKENREALENVKKENEQRNEEMSQQIAEKMDELSSEALSYRYERRTNTLYLMPNQESAGQGVKK